MIEAVSLRKERKSFKQISVTQHDKQQLSLFSEKITQNSRLSIGMVYFFQEKVFLDIFHIFQHAKILKKIF